jgi:S1-C subfamily serine protease
MLCLAASFAIASSTGQSRTLGAEDPLWTRLNRSVVQIKAASTTVGIGVLIDQQGLFLAHSSSADSAGPYLGSIGGRVLSLKKRAQDVETQLTLFRADGWEAQFGRPVRVAPQGTDVGEKLLAVTINGPVRAHLTSNDRVGQMRPSLRYAPLSEISLEAGLAQTSGAVAFNTRGELMGVFGATLSSGTEEPEAAAAGRFALQSQKLVGGAVSRFGPGPVTVGYAIGPTLLDRVVEGFRSPDRKVMHPTIGVFYKSHPKGGVVLETVMPNSAAEAAGLLEGDRIKSAGGTVVKSPIDLAVILFDQTPGDQLELVILRDGEEVALQVIVGSSSPE